MAVEVRPLGVKCNIQCQYCYQNPQRDAGNVARDYDLETLKQAIAQEGGPFVLFGGEPLLMPEDDLEELWRWGFERYRGNRIQTNAVLINDNHIRMFRAYRVHVGVSVDGPEGLNDARWTATLERTRRATAKTQAAIERLCREGIVPTLIVTLHRGNATRDKLPRMVRWLRHLEAIGVREARLHILEVDNGPVKDRYALSDDEVLEALTTFMRLEAEELVSLRFDLFAELGRLLLGRDDGTSCVWNACDPYTTEAVRGIEGHGQRSNCGRTNKDGIDFVKAEHAGFERSLALYRTDQSALGCKDCRFFLMCKGQCPGTSADGDWRNRSDYCGVWKGLFERVEARLVEEGLQPISLSPRRTALEALFLEAWRAGHNTNIAAALRELDRRPAAAPDSTPNSRADSVVESRATGTARAARVSWVSARAREVWDDRLRRVAAAVAELSWLSVAHGLRRCTVESLSPVDVDAVTARWAAHGLQAAANGIELFPTRPYYRREAADGSDDVVRIRFVVGRVAGDVAACRSALARDDHVASARLLGTPPCCATSYARAASRAENDVWRMAVVGGASPEVPAAVTVAGVAEANVVYRPLGLRAVPHVPCSFDCAATAALGRDLADLGRRVGYDAEMGWLSEVLDMPMEWSALHGIAQVRTPLLKMVTPAHPTDVPHRVRRPGGRSPEEGAVGLAFPYRMRRGTPLTEGTGYRRGLRNAPREAAATLDRLATDNGFRSVADMDVAHRPIVGLARTVLAGRRGGVIDLGCGNGLLLKRICADSPGLIPFGIDRDPERIRHAHALLPEARRGFVAGDLFDDDRLWTPAHRYAGAILMAGRLLAVDRDRAASLLRKIRSRCDILLVYVYSDAIRRWGSLDAIAQTVGLHLESPGRTVSVARVGSGRGDDLFQQQAGAPDVDVPPVAEVLEDVDDAPGRRPDEGIV